jgi:hypothetical protein
VIGDSKGNTRPGIRQLSAEFLTHGNHTMLAQLKAALPCSFLPEEVR